MAIARRMTGPASLPVRALPASGSCSHDCRPPRNYVSEDDAEYRPEHGACEELLLSTPLARARIIAEKFAAMTVGVAVLAAVTGFSLVLEGSLADMNLPAQNVAAAMVHLGLLALVFGTLALVLSASTGRTGLSRGIPAALAVAAYAVNGLAPLVDWLEPLQKYSPFFQYAGHDPLRNGIDMTDVLVAAATCLVLVALAAIGFRSRDTAA